MDCTADLLLIFLWEKTASGTARSKTDNIYFIPFPMLLLPVPEAVLSHTNIARIAKHCPENFTSVFKFVKLLFPKVLRQ